jgi:hypothetical protein
MVRSAPRIVGSGRRSGFGQFGSDRVDLSATKSGAVGAGRDLRGLAINDQQGHLGGHPTVGAALAEFVPVVEELVPGRQNTSTTRSRSLFLPISLARIFREAAD